MGRCTRGRPGADRMGFSALLRFCGRGEPRGADGAGLLPRRTCQRGLAGPRRGGRAVAAGRAESAAPPGTSCVRGKMAAPRPRCTVSKWRTRRPGRGAAGESPAQRPRARPCLAPLPWDPHSPPTPSGGQGAVLAARCLAVPERHMGWGRGFWTVELMGGDLSWASLALVVMLLGICPWSLDRSFFFSFRTVV